jgi:hypothetical protein
MGAMLYKKHKPSLTACGSQQDDHRCLELFVRASQKGKLHTKRREIAPWLTWQSEPFGTFIA